MSILRHARWPICLGTRLCFLSADLHLCWMTIFSVIHYLHPHKDFCFVFDSLQTASQLDPWLWSCDRPPKNHSICLSLRSLRRPWTCQKVLSFLSPFQVMCFYSTTYRNTSKILMYIFSLDLGLMFLSLNCHFNKLLCSLVLTHVSPNLALG